MKLLATNKVLLAVVLLAISALSCRLPTLPTPSPTPAQPSPVPATATAAPTATRTATAEDVQTITIQAIVYIRAEPDAASEAIGSLTTGETVQIVSCSEAWCELADGGWVFRGCTSDPAGLRCEARP